jgi:hypothetical protein
MEELSLFDHLVRELDSEQRRAMLVRMQNALPVYPVDLAPEEGAEPFEPEAEMSRLGLLRRLLLTLTAFFSGRDRAHLLRELYLRRVGEQIRRHNPGLIDFRTLRFLPGMRDELTRLAECSRALRGLLEGALGGERRAFVAFLARDELRGFHVQVVHDTDPAVLWARMEGPGGRSGREDQGTHGSQDTAAERALREEMLTRFQRLLDSIPEGSKQRLYRDSAALNGLHALTSFDFDTLKAPFKRHRGPLGRTCPVTDLLPPLRALAERLSVVDRPPSPQALYDLIVFSFREQLEEDRPELETQLKERLTGARAALEGIRNFHERVPLTLILRFVSHDPYYLPRIGGGGEDWFLLYQEFWRRRVHQGYLDFVDERLRGRLKKRCQELLQTGTLQEPENYHSGRFGADTPVRHSLSLAFLGQLARVFTELHRPLKLIYLNGEFFKEENRRAYTDAFDFLDRLGGGIAALEERLGPAGDLRAAIQEIRSAQLGRRLQSLRIREVLARADIDARSLAEEARTQAGSMAALLRGILKGRPGDRYDTIANLKSLGGRENRQLAAAWDRAMRLSEAAHDLLEEIVSLELRRE